MADKLIRWIGAKANVLVVLLALCVAGNVLFQAYTHKTTPLLAWKGGGFGMYTEPHQEDRSLWVTFQGADGAASVRLWPQTSEYQAWQAKAGLRGTQFLNGLSLASERFLYYPKVHSADAIIATTARVRWPENMVGDVVPIEGKVFKPKDITLTVFENRYDVNAQTVVRTHIFERTAQGAF